MELRGGEEMTGPSRIGRSMPVPPATKKAREKMP